MNQKKIKKIRRFGKLRFAGHPRYNEDILFAIYSKADDLKRKELDAEMDAYFEAINTGKIQAGESIIKSALS